MRKRNKLGILCSLMFLMSVTLYSCGQDYNSNSGDSNLGQDTSKIDCTTESGARFCAALTILQAECSSCHTHSIWGSYVTEAQWTKKLVKPGDADTSSLITKLKNVGGNMPQDAGALSDDDFQTLRTWINEMPTMNVRAKR